MGHRRFRGANAALILNDRSTQRVCAKPLRPGRNASELLEEAEPVQLDPVLSQLAAGEAGDDDDGPRHGAAGRSDPLPFALLGRVPVATPDASVAGEE